MFPFILKTTQENYLTFLVVGIIPWNIFTTTIMQGTTCILMNAGIIKKVYFPREILPISIATSGLVNFLISFIVIFLFVIFSGIGISYNILFLPLVILAQYLLSLGIIFITSAVDVYIRDAEYIINFFINMLFYATPIVYNSTMFPANVRWILELNPMTQIITCYRDILLYKTAPPFQDLFLLLLLSMILVYLGHKIFKKLEKRFAEEL